MSANSAVTYTSVHSETRSWSIPSKDPYEDYKILQPIPEANTPPRKRLLLTTPRPRCEVGESSAAAAARQPGPTMARRVDCSSIDTMETRVRDTERRMMAALEVVNVRVSYQVDVRSRESSEFYLRHHDAQKDRATVRAEIEVLRRERLAYEQESIQTSETLARSEAHCRTLEARIIVLETEARRHESTPVTPAPTTTTTTITEAQLQALIDRGVAAAMAEAEASRVRNGYDSNGSGPRPETSCRDMPYFEFLKCKPWTLKALRISDSLEDDALTWWNAHVKTTTPEAAHAMPWATLKKMMTDKYCPRGEIKKIETEMWNLKVKGTDVGFTIYESQQA
ncbi:putative reverse transcriptase domain-containing protein [Tanacetum coccineum]|uniref:Reverse transcriptase domain-containing protein n=1 Tax=Tanacetum coccineum TaxID=301880 RepID=A0ABQ5F0F1_9ASTR